MMYKVRYLGKYDNWVVAFQSAVSPKQAVYLVGKKHKYGKINALYNTEMCQVTEIIDNSKPVQLSLDFQENTKEVV